MLTGWCSQPAILAREPGLERRPLPVSDALENQKTIPWSYVGQALGYVIGYLGASLALALLLFEDRELT